jgi:translocation and assembly module TamB
MDATLSADIRGSSFDSLAVDAATARVRIAGGVATVDSLSAAGAGATLEAHGAFGLVAGRDGTLVYHLTADSLAAFNRYLPAADTGLVAARPARVAQARARASADSASEAERVAVEQAALGTKSVQQAAKVAEAPPVRRDSLGGSVYAAGAMRGNVATFSLRGRAGASNLVAFGNTVHELRTEYAWMNARTPGAMLAIGVDADTLSTYGFALDSAQLRVTYNPTTGDGDVLALVKQLGDEEYYARAQYALKLDQKELRLADLALRFDTTLWAASRPSAVRWGARGIEVDSIDLRNGTTGRIFVDGRIPKVGDADLRLIVNDFQVGDVLDLAQSDLAANGLLSVDATLRGTLAAPRVSGTVGVKQATYSGSVVPDVRARLDYADASLGINVELARPDSASLTFLTAVGRIPVNLASGATGPRLSRTAPITLDVDADSLPLELIPRFTDAVADVRGRAALHAKVRGTMDDVQVDGALMLADGRVRILANGVTLTRIGGNIRFNRDSVLVDSLVAYSDGSIRLRGGLGVRKLTEPSFNLFLTADEAKVLDGDLGKLYASAGLAVQGPFNDVYVSGAVNGVHGVIRLPESTGKTLVSSNDPAMFAVIDTALADERRLLPAQSPLLANLRVDVDLDIGRNTWVRRSDVNVEAYSDGPLAVHVNRRTQALTLEGVVASDRGEYDVAGKRFQITRGSATFIGTPDLNPIVQATAEYLVNIPSREALTLRVIVGGTLKAPRISLESDAQPPISQSDLLSYLAFSQSSSSLLSQNGSSASGSNAGGGGRVVGTAGKLVQQQIAGQAVGQIVQTVQSDIGRSLGADVFRISAADVSTEATNATRGNFGGLITGTNVEYGRFLTPELYVAAQGTPGSLTFQQKTNTPIGLLAQRRTAKGFQYEASFEPRYILQTPTLGTQDVRSRGVLGLFVTKEWRF